MVKTSEEAKKLGEKTQFKKGTTGNKNGRPRKLPKLDVLLADVLGEEKDGQTAATAILIAMRKKAIAGDTKAADLLLDRAYGKVKQDFGLTDKDGNDVAPIQVITLPKNGRDDIVNSIIEQK